jgi:twitching motility protein PilI
MANRSAIRELQTRLAARLQAARTEGVSIAWLAVKAGAGNYLFPLVQAGEIFPLANLQPVPYCKNWFAGVVNLRGGLYGVVDLAGFIGSGDGSGSGKPIARTDLALSEASVVTVHAALEVNCALMVDNLAGLRSADAFAQSAPPESTAPSYFGNRYTDAQGVLWQEINLQTLSQYTQFLSIGT